MRVRVVCARAYHALFMHNMLIRPTAEELDEFTTPDILILNAGQFPANRLTACMTSSTSIDVHVGRKEIVILGTEYAGEMKKGLLSLMNYLMPLRGVLSLHSACNVSLTDPSDVSMFFGLSGTGKTTLSTDEKRLLIGDDEHCWGDGAVWGIEGGCYAKCINLKPEAEPEIYAAIRFGAVLENVVYGGIEREVDWTDASITENTRAAYPIEHIPRSLIPCLTYHNPRNILMLACDAFGVLPPVSHLTTEQAVYHFLSGYTAKIAGTEEGVKTPVATFSSCFGEPFLMLHPWRYGEMLQKKLEENSNIKVWLINTGWTGGPYGIGKRIPLKATRAILDAIHANKVTTSETFPVFNLRIPSSLPEVDAKILHPERAWSNRFEFEESLKKLGSLFTENFSRFKDIVPPELLNRGGPKLQSS